MKKLGLHKHRHPEKLYRDRFLRVPKSGPRKVVDVGTWGEGPRPCVVKGCRSLTLDPDSGLVSVLVNVPDTSGSDVIEPQIRVYARFGIEKRIRVVGIPARVGADSAWALRLCNLSSLSRVTQRWPEQEGQLGWWLKTENDVIVFGRDQDGDMIERVALATAQDVGPMADALEAAAAYA